MSFSSDVKEELSKISNKNKECCKLSELAGYLITNCNIARSNGDFVLKMTTESESAIRRVYNAFRSLYDVTPITNIEKKIEGRDTLLELVVQDKSDLQKIFSNSWINIDVNLHIVIDTNNKIKDNECCMRSFMRGVFMGGGSVSDPKASSNHLEIVLNNEQNAPKDYYIIRNKIEVKDEKTGSCITILPDDQFSITAMCSFQSKFINSQFATIDDVMDFPKEIAPARTFVFVRDIIPLLQANLIKGGDLDNAIVIYEREVTQEKLDQLVMSTVTAYELIKRN